MGIEVAAGMMIVGTGLQVMGQYQQAQAAIQQQNFLAQQAEQNRLLSIEKAKDAFWRGEQEEEEFRESIRQLKATQVVNFAASGIDVTSGTPIDVLNSTTEQAEKDALTIRMNAHNEAYAYLMGAQQYGQEAGFRVGAAEATAQAFPLTAGATLLTGTGMALR